MFSYTHTTAYDSEPVIPDGVKKALCWLGAAVVVGFMWTLPGWLMVWGVI